MSAQEAGAGLPWQQPWLRELLRCPADRARLLDATGPEGGLELRCTDPGHAVAYPVLDGVPVLLADEARPAAGTGEDR
ncbi:Trm112 family protein [Quadrisphaera sp. DSM 44207]|uniref:Trm112 family protein n=1 Tax=Quadrisphaera sp. DSM 44207 TaxID=1881057 RepID=UPI0008906DE4|nr:hypothetical protein [Quadrisphaera sp. DSM 44207]SDQ09336.1 hypothetical protein SAMN05428996_0486 [Quadrisphaera sp. DSM 44207]